MFAPYKGVLITNIRNQLRGQQAMLLKRKLPLTTMVWQFNDSGDRNVENKVYVLG